MTGKDYDHLIVLASLNARKIRIKRGRKVGIANKNGITTATVDQEIRRKIKSAPETENENETGTVVAASTTATVNADAAMVAAGAEGAEQVDEERDGIIILLVQIGRWRKEWDFKHTNGTLGYTNTFRMALD